MLFRVFFEDPSKRQIKNFTKNSSILGESKEPCQHTVTCYGFGQIFEGITCVLSHKFIGQNVCWAVLVVSWGFDLLKFGLRRLFGYIFSFF
jgi:hypothetical protein